MSTKTILIVAAGTVLSVVVLLIGRIFLWIQPTRGDKIEQYSDPQQALLVIDIQEDFTGPTAQPPFAYKDSDQLITTVNTSIEGGSQGRYPHRLHPTRISWSLGQDALRDVFWRNGFAGSPGAQIDERIAMLSGNVFTKPRGDAFSNPDLDAFLIEHQVNELYLVGLDAEYCIHHTAWGALNRGYAVNIITDGVALRAEEKWEDLLQQYREEGITLLSSEQFLEQTP